MSCGGISGSNQTIKVYYNDSVVATIEGSGSNAFPENLSANAIEAGIMWEALILNNASVSAQKSLCLANYTMANGTTLFAYNTYNAQSASSLGRSSGFFFTEGTSAVSTDGMVVLRVTITNSANNASTKFRHENIVVEKIG